MRLSGTDHKRVSDAIASAERSTSGEIFCVIAEATDDYRAVAFAWAALAALVLPPLLLWSGVVGPQLLSAGWHVSASTMAGARPIVALYATLSVLLFIAALLIARIPPITRRLTPTSLKRAAVHRRAMESFLSHGIHVTEDRTGVVIFLSMGDHVAEIVADEAIHARVDPDAWGAAISTLLEEVRQGRIADGFVRAIAACGMLLAEHFPPRERNPNELPDKLIEL
jgi:putative membrane protein